MPRKDKSKADSRASIGAGAAARRVPVSSPGIKSSSLYGIIPFMLAVLSSLNSLWNGFASDDSHQVVANAFIKNVSNLPYAFTTSVWSFAADDIVFSVDPYYRPLFNILFTINYALFGTTAWGWHLTNVLIHAAVTLLVYVVIIEIAESREVALISASLFAVHPAHAESVAWVSGITDPLMAIFLLPAFYFYLRYRKTGRNSLMAAAIGCYFLALFCKETALALPLAVAYCELFHFKDAGPFKRRVARLLALAGLFVIPTVIYIIMRYIALSRPLGNVPLRPLGSALATIPLAVAKYLALLVFPTGYSYQHPTPFVESFFSMRFLGPAFLIAVLAGAVFLIRSQAVKLAAAWFIITLAPALYAIRQFGAENVVQERYLYLPSIGFCLVVALAIERIAGSSLFAARSRIVAISISAALIAVWGAVLIRQNRVWDEDITLFKNCVEVDPDSPVARIALARAYFDAGRTRDAEAEIQTALQIDPNNAGALVTLSYFAHKEGKLEKSIEYLKSAASNVEESHIAHTVLGTIYLNTGLIYWELKDMSRAEEYLLRSIETWPRPVGWYHTGNFYVDQGRYEEARTIYERSLEQLPRWYAPIHLKLGQVYERLGQSARAKAAYERYLEVTPSSLETRNEAMLRLRIQKLND